MTRFRWIAFFGTVFLSFWPGSGLLASDFVQRDLSTERFLVGETEVRNTLVVVIDFQNRSVACSTNSVEALVFSGTPSLTSLYAEVSGGLLKVASDLDEDEQSDVYRVALAANHEGSCDYRNWQTQANTELETLGVDASDYNQRFYVLPFVDQIINATGAPGRDYNDDICSWAGIASGSSTVTLNRCELPDVYIHEMGHNLGLQHAAIDLDDNGEMDDGPLAAYLDHSDFMGEAAVGWRQLNAPHKLEMNWLDEATVLDVSEGEHLTIELTALEAAPSEPNTAVLRIEIPSSDQSYYISYRSKLTEVDADLKDEYNLKTNIHRYPSATRSLFVKALDDGETFTSSAIDFSVTQVSHTETTVTLQIGEGGTSEENGSVSSGCASGQSLPWMLWLFLILGLSGRQLDLLLNRKLRGVWHAF